MALILLTCIITTMILYLYCENNQINDSEAFPKMALEFLMFITSLMIFWLILYSCF